jgi:TolB protein
MKADGSDVRRLTQNDIDDTYASWSPDGGKIALRKRIEEPGIDGEGKPYEFNSEVFVMGADGANAVNVTRHPAFDGWPSWSPDGRRILFASNRSGVFQIYVMKADGSGVQTLVTSPTGEDHTKPIWSRDGRKIIFTRTKDGNVEIFTLDVQP